ncbi:S-adenosyl-L-methionine-dependent methyltransferase [Lindgomyces ingoldianus]|uniref:S-adenosyl-L-methionine-dependent methyltransferase n=1 Tax=Lindgomyces ingoldianus TaxID=673940 RepID=A0ACB6QXK9_9PLEO|nr:S-adenosyl-L-methionine-dependent methyltransferase [Lindgomyces ingoldianus]KAF2471774.1 S-adenosyl-L-methionine-dependent methyltransferase [Lindgomyces ingoldianus]
MEAILEDLIASLRTVSKQLQTDAKPLLQESLHDTDKLPDFRTSALASEAVDLLSELRLLLEPGHAVLADHFLGYTNTKCLVAAVDLNIPDALRSGPKTLFALAEVSNSRHDRLGQVLRTLTNNGIFTYDISTKTYSNNHVSTLLQSDHWSQWRNLVELYGNEFYDMARGIPESIGAGVVRTPAQINYDTDESMFDYFTEKGWIEKFQKTLSAGATAQVPGILEDYPWHVVADASILDVGGGTGGFIASLLGKFKNMKGAILDLPEVIQQAKSNFHSTDGQYAKVQDQIPEENLIAGDFFVEVPSSEVYVMKWCLHDWDDEKATIVLKNIRRAIKKGNRSRLVILESVLKSGDVGRLSRYADLNMMVAVGSKERDEEEWRALAAASGWQIRMIYDLRNAWPSAIEFFPVWEDPTVVAKESIPEHSVSLANGDQAVERPLLLNGVDAVKPTAADVKEKETSAELIPTESHVNETAQEEPAPLRSEVQLQGEPSQPQTPAQEPASKGLASAEPAPLVNGISTSPSQTTAQMRFLEPWDPSRGNPYIRTNPCQGYDHMNFKWQEHSVPITNARPKMNDFNLDIHGFTYAKDEISPDLIDALRQNQRDTVKQLYYPQVTELAMKLTGGKRVIVFDHTHRKRGPEPENMQNGNIAEQPATMVHCDQFEEAAIRRLRENLHPWEDVDTVLRGRVQMINIWRPLAAPVQDWPLATMDYQSVEPDAIQPCDLLRETFEKRGQTATFKHSEDQKWYYLDKQTTDEVTAIKIWDNLDGVSRICAHAPFKNPAAPKDIVLSESIEVRCLVLDEPESKWFSDCPCCKSP